MLRLSSLDFQHVEKVELGEKVLQPFQILVQDELFQSSLGEATTAALLFITGLRIDFNCQMHRLAGISHPGQEFVHAGHRLAATAFRFPQLRQRILRRSSPPPGRWCPHSG